MQQTGPVYLVRAMHKSVPTIRVDPTIVFFLSPGPCRIIAQVNIVRAVEVKGSQKSKLRIGVDDCIQKIAIKLANKIIHQRHLCGANQHTSSENKLKTMICVRFIY